MKFISILAFFLISVTIVWAQPQRAFRVAQFDIYYSISDEGTAIQVSKIVEEVQPRLQRLFPSVQFSKRYGIVVLTPAEWSAFRQRMQLPPWSGGVYVENVHKIFLPSGGVTHSLFTLDHTVRHELAHLFLHTFLDTISVPRWYHEGFAEYVGKGNLSLEDGVRLANAIWGKNLLLLEDIDSLNYLSTTRARLAYAESLSAFLFVLTQLGGQAALANFHQTIKELGWEKAITATFKMDSIDFEIKWYHWLEKEYRWFIFANLDFWLWVVAVLGFIGIYWHIRRRNKKRLAQWEFQEQWQLWEETPPEGTEHSSDEL